MREPIGNRLKNLVRPVKIPGWTVIIFAVLPDWYGRADFWKTILGGGYPMIEPILLSPWFSLALVIIGLVYLVFVGAPVRHVHHKEIQAQTAPVASLSTAVHRAPAAPDWPIRELFFHVNPDILETSEQDEFDSTCDLIQDQFSTGQLSCWGREIDGSHRLPLALIPIVNWQHLKLIPWLLDSEEEGGNVLQAKRRRPNSPVPEYTDLHVSRAQALLRWPTAASKRIGQGGVKQTYIPIHEAIAHVAMRIRDTHDKEFFAATRRLVRQRARDGDLRMRGRKQVVGSSDNRSYFREIKEDIPKDYWADSVLSLLTIEPGDDDFRHTDPENAQAWGPRGILAINSYASLCVNNQDLERLWP